MATAHGYELVDANAPVKNFPPKQNVNANLLEKHLKHVWQGSDTMDIVTVNVVANMRVTFPEPFPVGVVPVVITQIRLTVGQASRFLTVAAEDRFGFTAYGLNTSNNIDFAFTWIARG